jgi:hypothetical protein
MGSSARPIFVVPTGWKMVVAMSPASRASSSSLWNCAPGLTSVGCEGLHGGLCHDAARDPQGFGGDPAVGLGAQVVGRNRRGIGKSTALDMHVSHGWLG